MLLMLYIPYRISLMVTAIMLNATYQVFRYLGSDAPFKEIPFKAIAFARPEF